MNEAYFTRHRIFKSHNSHVWPDANPHCCVCALPLTTFCGQLLGKHCVWLFDWALLVTPTAQYTDLPMFLEEKLPEMLEEIPLAFKEKHMVPARRDCPSPCTSGLTSHRYLQRSLNCIGRACGLASQVSWPHTNELLTMRPHWTLDLHVASWLWRDSYCPYWWGSGNHHAATWHFWLHTSNSAALLSAVCRGRWPHVWISALNWY